jgi:prepilin-type N-terminal cleavage/methylation domain-containing protein
MPPSLFCTHLRRWRPHAAFTLIELLVVIAILAVLAGLSLAGAAVVRERARTTATRMQVQALSEALLAYQNEGSSSNHRRRLPLHEALWPTAPTIDVVQSFHRDGLIALLEDRGLLPPLISNLHDGVLTDRWNQPIHYFIRWPRPGEPGAPTGMPTHAAHAAAAIARNASRPDLWNWLTTEDVNGDGTLDRAEDVDGDGAISTDLPRAWWRPDPAQPRREPAPFPYVLSLGSAGSWSDPKTWIYTPDRGIMP